MLSSLFTLLGKRNRKNLPRRRPAFFRPVLEALEDRTVLSPMLSYSSYLPGPAWAIAVDGSGDTYLTGGNGWGGSGAYVAKLNATGSAVDWVVNLTPSTGFGTGIAVDPAGDVYVTGWTADSTFQTTPNALDTTKPSTTQPGFLTVLNPAGSLLYSTWLPGTQFAGTGANRVNGRLFAIDQSGNGNGSLDNVYITGEAVAGLLTTAGAFQPSLGGGTDAFLAKIDPNLSGSASLLYGSYLGGSGSDEGSGVAVDASDNAYITGRTSSTNFPTTAAAFQQKNRGGVDVFVAKLNPSLSGTASLVYSTYLGGSGSDGYGTDYPANLSVVEPGPGIAVDSAGDAYVAGTTTSTNFPTTPGAFQTAYKGPQGDAFVTKLNPTGTGLVYSTYLGGSYNTGGAAIAVDASGNADVTGWTRSTDFPTVNPIQATKGSGVDSADIPVSNVFVTTLNSSGSGLLFSTYFGGSGGSFNKHGVFSGSDGDVYGYAIALDSAGDVYLAGSTSSTGQPISTSFPTTAGAFDTTPGGGLVFEIDPPVRGGATPATARLSSGAPVVFPGRGIDGIGGTTPGSADSLAAFMPGGLAPAAGQHPFLGELAGLLNASDGAAEWSPADLVLSQAADGGVFSDPLALRP